MRRHIGGMIGSDNAKRAVAAAIGAVASDAIVREEACALRDDVGRIAHRRHGVRGAIRGNGEEPGTRRGGDGQGRQCRQCPPPLATGDATQGNRGGDYATIAHATAAAPTPKDVCAACQVSV